jgi:hypothetical protein
VQQLHLVGFTTDHRGLIFSTRRGAKSGSFVLPVDEAITSAVAEATTDAEPPPDDELVPVRPESTLSVKEVQARLRAGRTIKQVASEAGVDPAWVERFAVPVLAEQAETVRTVRAATFSKPRLGASGVPLGEAVYRNLADKGVLAPVDELDRAWTARQPVEGVWVVSFRYRSRGRDQTATWELDERTGQLTARDRLAAQLAHRPAPVRRTQPAPSSDAPPSARGRRSPGRAQAKRVAAARKAAVKQLNETVRQRARRDVVAARKAAEARTKAAKEAAKTQPAAKATKGATKATTTRKATKATATRKATKATTTKHAPNAPKRSTKAPTKATATKRATRATATKRATKATATKRATKAPKRSTKAPTKSTKKKATTTPRPSRTAPAASRARAASTPARPPIDAPRTRAATAPAPRVRRPSPAPEWARSTAARTDEPRERRLVVRSSTPRAIDDPTAGNGDTAAPATGGPLFRMELAQPVSADATPSRRRARPLRAR